MAKPFICLGEQWLADLNFLQVMLWSPATCLKEKLHAIWHEGISAINGVCTLYGWIVVWSTNHSVRQWSLFLKKENQGWISKDFCYFLLKSPCRGIICAQPNLSTGFLSKLSQDFFLNPSLSSSFLLIFIPPHLWWNSALPSKVFLFQLI